MLSIHTIDAHAAGEPLRLIVDGYPAPRGRTMLEKREWLGEHHDELRRALMLEPRGHADMYGALLTQPERTDSDAGVLFMHNQGYSTMCGHGVIAVVTIGIERRLLDWRTLTGTVILDAPAGVIRARPTIHKDRVTSVSFTNVPSFVLYGGVPIRAGGRDLRVDVAFGGAFYAIVDSEAAGIPIVADRLGDLRRLGMEIKGAAEAAVKVQHPSEPLLHDIYGTVFTGPPTLPEADLRNVTIFADAEVDRSPCGTGTCAVMAVLAEMGVLGESQTFTHESIIGTTFKGRITGRTKAGEIEAIVPEIEGSAFVTGESTFLIDEDDPLRLGFRL
jgi:proline racemase